MLEGYWRIAKLSPSHESQLEKFLEV